MNGRLVHLRQGYLRERHSQGVFGDIFRILPWNLTLDEISCKSLKATETFWAVEGSPPQDLTWMSCWKLGSMVSKWVISPTYKWDILGLTHPLILTIDPNFQQDILVYHDISLFVNLRLFLASFVTVYLMYLCTFLALSQYYYVKLGCFTFFWRAQFCASSWSKRQSNR